MGKKVSPSSSMKISKKNDEKKKPLLNSVINVLRPKVYITDSSSFKQLVQELTGNGNGNGNSNGSGTFTNSSLQPSRSSEPNQNISVIDIDGEDHRSELLESCSVDELSRDRMESYSNGVECITVGTVAPNSVESYYNNTQLSFSCLINDYFSNQPMWNYYEDKISGEVQNSHIASEWSSVYQDLESWLLDTADHQQPFSSSCNFAPFGHDQGVCIYDYELSGLLE